MWNILHLAQQNISQKVKQRPIFKEFKILKVELENNPSNYKKSSRLQGWSGIQTQGRSILKTVHLILTLHGNEHVESLLLDKATLHIV